ncbi:hypothetical protein [Aestuariivita sp.]|jgi:hypothetical protein|uniref:hypothetical protein n=1 Tax=Aestuariivita sp. TaxID=1872407 RepID=UPI002170C6BF|nr:hypothetical protein [Aestuariivita sp.]MCE8009587.1 hypothetical protein [Aestuariivita sp.]
MSPEARNTLWAVAVLVTAVSFGASSFVIPDFGGFDADQFPVPQEDPAVQPAGYAFAIWAVIYLWLLAGAAFGVLARADAPDWEEMRPYLVMSLAVGTSWLAVAKLSAFAAAILIWAMLIPALLALFRAPLLDRWWARAPIGLYAGWLSAASFVALGLVLAGWGVMGEVQAAILCLVLATALASVIQVALEGVPEYGAAVVWALLAVAVNNLGGALFVVVLALTGAAVVGLLALRAMTIPRA